MKNLTLILLISTAVPVYAQTADSAQFYYKKGLSERTSKLYLQASKSFDKAIKLDPSNTAAYLENGYVHLEMKKTDQATRNFVKVYEQQPGNKDAIRELMTLYYNYRQYNKATEFARKCTDCPGVDKIMGMNYYRDEDYPKAEKALLVALSKNPADAEAVYTLARTYLDMEEYQKAIPYYEKAVTLDKTKYNWMYELGLLYFNLQKYDASVSALQSAAANGYKENNDFKENLGYAALYSGDYEKGEQLILDIWSKKPGNKDILRDMADILYQQKQYDRSLNYCQKLLGLDSGDSKALYQAGLNFQKKGQKDKGQQMCDKAIEMDPSLASLRQEKKMPGM